MDEQNKTEEELEEWVPHCGEYESARPTRWNGCPFCLGKLKREGDEE